MNPKKQEVLTPKETKITKLICKELTNKEIALQLKVSLRTIEWYRENIMRKTKSKTAIGIFKYALKNKIVKFKQA